MKVIIADSNELIRVGIRTILNTDKTLEIVSEARNSEELLSEIQNFGADIILIDYTSPGFTKYILSVEPNLIKTGDHLYGECSLPQPLDEIIFSHP